MSDPETANDPDISPAMIRAARGLLGISQKDLSEMVGIDRRTLTKIESGAKGRPDARRRAVLATIRKALEDKEAIGFLFADGSVEEGIVRRRRPAE